MSIDYYSCAICGHNFPDCGDYVSCEHCFNHFCSKKCAKMAYAELDEEADIDNNEEEEYPHCCICRKEAANDYILLEALLRHFNLTREQALEIWQKQPDEEEEDDGE